jgi:glycosyltransferase involved in cell wall biosynthesis
MGLKATLQSICDQSESVSVLVVDGLSSDTTVEVARSFEIRLKLEVTSEPDRGPYDAMNKGLRIITSKYVLFLNAGDRFFSDHSLKTILESLTHHQGTWHVGGYAVGDLAGPVHSLSVPRKLTFREFTLGRRSICHQAVIADVKALRLVGGFDTDFPICADFKAMTQLWQSESPHMIEEPLVIYRPGGISDRSPISNFRERNRIRNQLLNLSYWHLLVTRYWYYWFLARRVTGLALDNLATRKVLPKNWRAVKSLWPIR